MAKKNFLSVLDNSEVVQNSKGKSSENRPKSSAVVFYVSLFSHILNIAQRIKNNISALYSP